MYKSTQAQVGKLREWAFAKDISEMNAIERVQHAFKRKKEAEKLEEGEQNA